MIKCPSCGHENVDGTTFCEMCGEELQTAPGVDDNPPSATVTNGAVGVAGASDSTSESAGDIKCPACENLNPRENVVCEVCGTELHPAGSDVAGAAAPPSTPAVSDATAATATTPPVAPDTTPATSPAAADGSGTAGTGTAAATDMSEPDAGAGTTAAPLKPGQVKLVVEQGMNVGKQFVLGDEEMQVGREDEEEEIYPDIDLADQDEGYVHRKHATLKFEDDQLFVTHLGGANKTRLNNKPIPDNAPQPVKLGDKLAFGKVVLRVLPHSAG